MHHWSDKFALIVITAWVGALWAIGYLAAPALFHALADKQLAGMLAGKSAGLSPKASSNIGLTIVSRGEFSIIVANVGIAANLDEKLQPFAALYVLILAILGPLLTKESKLIYKGLNRLFRWEKPKQKQERGTAV